MLVCDKPGKRVFKVEGGFEIKEELLIAKGLVGKIMWDITLFGEGVYKSESEFLNFLELSALKVISRVVGGVFEKVEKNTQEYIEKMRKR